VTTNDRREKCFGPMTGQRQTLLKGGSSSETDPQEAVCLEVVGNALQQVLHIPYERGRPR
jgi:hypothetical protein